MCKKIFRWVTFRGILGHFKFWVIPLVSKMFHAIYLRIMTSLSANLAFDFPDHFFSLGLFKVELFLRPKFSAYLTKKKPKKLWPPSTKKLSEKIPKVISKKMFSSLLNFKIWNRLIRFSGSGDPRFESHSSAWCNRKNHKWTVKDWLAHKKSLDKILFKISLAISK